MIKFITACAAFTFAGSVFAAAHSAAPAATDTPKTAQQNKMASCNKEATGKSGEDRKAFMKKCLSAQPKASDAQKAQQEKMKSCNAEAKEMKGDERKKFMSACLKKD